MKKLNENVLRKDLNLNLGDQNEVNSYLGVKEWRLKLTILILHGVFIRLCGFTCKM